MDANAKEQGLLFLKKIKTGEKNKMKTINTEVAVIVLVGFLLTVSGIYLNFQNLEQIQRRNVEVDTVYTNEIVYGTIQIIGMAIIFVGLTRGLLRRSDMMANKFINIMDVFTSLVKRQLDVIDDHEKKTHMKEIDEKSRKFRDEMMDLKRI
jgi:uncharacterized membrane protein YidH (DUF202 family)